MGFRDLRSCQVNALGDGYRSNSNYILEINSLNIFIDKAVVCTMFLAELTPTSRVSEGIGGLEGNMGVGWGAEKTHPNPQDHLQPAHGVKGPSQAF